MRRSAACAVTNTDGSTTKLTTSADGSVSKVVVGADGVEHVVS
jgi:hypothetical protein